MKHSSRKKGAEDRRQQRRENAMNRFRIMTEEQWRDRGLKGGVMPIGDNNYAAYLERKNQEIDALKRQLHAA